MVQRLRQTVHGGAAMKWKRFHGDRKNALELLEDGEQRSIRELVASAGRQALFWPVQNHLVIWLLSPWVFASLGVVLMGAFTFVAGAASIETAAAAGFLGFVLILLMLLSNPF